MQHTAQPNAARRPSAAAIRLRIGQILAAGAATTVLIMAPAFGQTSAPVEKVVIKATARFGFDGTSINEQDRQAMLAEVGKLKDVTWQTVTATGHTDSVGNAGYNQRLSVRRAAAVKSYLVSNGLAPSMVQARGVASQQPVASNDDEAGRAQNRRADVEFQGVRVSTK